MTLRSLIAGALFALAPLTLAAGSARAQTGLYLNPIAMRISNTVADHGLYAFLGQYDTSRMFYGINFGGYYDFKTPYPFKAGLELRDSILHGSGAELNNFLVGIRLSAKPFHNNFKPYLEPMAGIGTSRAPFTVLHISKGEYGVYAGLDYETHHHVDLHILEAGYSTVMTASSETIGGTQAVPAATLIVISTGLVFRFP